MVASAMPSTFSRVWPLATRMPNSLAAARSNPSMPVVGDTIPRSRSAESISSREHAKLDAATSTSASLRPLFAAWKPALSS